MTPGQELGLAIRTYEQVAKLMAERGFPMCKQRVYQIERRAFQKIAADPVLRQMAKEIGQ